MPRQVSTERERLTQERWLATSHEWLHRRRRSQPSPVGRYERP